MAKCALGWEWVHSSKGRGWGKAIARDVLGQHNVAGGRTFRKRRFSCTSAEGQRVSEKSTRNNLNYAVESRAARNCSVSRPQCQLCPAILLKSGAIHVNQCRRWRFQIVLQSRETMG